nr:type III secretion protein [uncultured Pseudomonas sp.]
MAERKHLMNGLGMLLSVLLCVSHAKGSDAQSNRTQHNPPWFEQPYAYVLVEQDLRDALTEFARNLNVTVVMSDQVRGQSRRNIRGEAAGGFLSRLCDSNGLNWFYDGNILYISASAETDTRVFNVKGQALGQLEDYLAGLDVYGQQMSARPSAVGGEMRVSGPPAYLNMIQQHMNQLKPPAVARARGVRVYRGGTVTEVSN